jgi:hypothetical protein
LNFPYFIQMDVPLSQRKSLLCQHCRLAPSLRVTGRISKKAFLQIGKQSNYISKVHSKGSL